MPTAALTYNLQALINLELFVYTLKVVHAINALVDDPRILPRAMQTEVSDSPPEIYLDFTGTQQSLSRSMAAYCVRRDIEAYQRFLASNLLLRQLSGYVDQLRRVPARAKRIDEILAGTTEGPRYLQGLLMLMRDPEIGSRLENKADDDETLIRQEYPNENGEDDADLASLDEIAGSAASSIERVVTMLTVGQSKQVISSYMKWYWSVGGLIKPHGILAGSPNTRGCT